MFSKKDKSVNMSSPQTKILHGVEIKKLPIGRYIKLMRHAESFVPDVLLVIFPEMKEGKISAEFSDITAEGLHEILARLLAVVPEKMCQIAGELLGIPEGDLLDPDNGLTPVQLMEILIALWEVNDYKDFFPNVRRLKGLVKLSAAPTGSSDG